MKAIHCESGPYSRAAKVTGHYQRDEVYAIEGTKTLCGKTVSFRGGKRWTVMYQADEPLTPTDCKRCIAIAAKEKRNER